MYTNIHLKERLENGIEMFTFDGVTYFEMSEERLIQGMLKSGLEVSQLETAHYKEKGYIQKNTSFDAFIKQAKRMFGFIKLATNEKGKELSGTKRRYIVANRYETVQEAEDKRATNIGRPKKNPTLNEFAGTVKNDYKSNYLATVYARHKDNEEVNGAKGKCVYRIVKDNKVAYVGLSTNLLNRSRFHMTKGHDSIPKEVYDGAHFEYLVFDSEFMMNMAETYFINKYRCSTNIGKMYENDSNDTMDFFEDMEWRVL